LNAQVSTPKAMLFSPYQLRGVTFPNRIVIAPMQMYKTGPDGKATDWHFQHLAKFAVGGAGTVMTEALIVDPIGRNTYGDCGIWSDDHIPPLARIVEFLRGQGAVPAASCTMPGRSPRASAPGRGSGRLEKPRPRRARRPGSR
jgi:2,4-dienoyl-CoA reductase-like NADH-dependent reductase (Old Yellow Enzyme family)